MKTKDLISFKKPLKQLGIPIGFIMYWMLFNKLSHITKGKQNMCQVAK